MLSPSDYNSAVPQFANGEYASNPINPLYIEEPTAVDYNRGVEPLQTLPAQWWNWFGKQFTSRFNKLNIYVKNIFNELAQLISLVNITPDGTEQSPTVGQLKTMFQTEYPKYMALLMYPVGSLYWTGKAPNDGGDPNELFGGTWVQIKGMFVFAKGDSDVLDATGGEKNHTLTKDELPLHTHSIGGSTGSANANISIKTASGSFAMDDAPATSGDGYIGQTGFVTLTRNYSSTGGCIDNIGAVPGGNVDLSHSHGITQSGHSHTLPANTGNNTTNNTAHNNMPPYVVKYCWQRTA